jgi:hypothetical protein
MLVYHYSKRIGNVKYWIVISLPLVYFLSQFITLFLNSFNLVIEQSPIFFGVLLSVIFPLSKAAGGILFGIAFWTIFKAIKKPNIVREYLLITAVGYTLLFVSDQAIALTSTPYPPFGLTSVSTVGLSSYLILVGLYYSAISISDDAKLRQTIRKLAISESKLLDSIGSAQMEQEIQKRVITLTKQTQRRIKEETGIQSSLTEEDMKLYLEEVINEVKKAHQHK